MGFKTWAQHAEAWFASFFHNANWAHQASVGLALAAPPAILILKETAGTGASAETANVIAETEKDLNDVSLLLAQAQKDPNDPTVAGEIRIVLTDIKTNLPTILADAHIKNHANVDKATEIADALIAEIEAVLSMMPVSAVGTSAPSTK